MQKIIGTAAILSYLSDLKRTEPDDYVGNEEQYNKFLKVIEYCQFLEATEDCQIYRCVFNPAWLDGNVEMLFHTEWAINSDRFKILLDTLSLCDGLNVSVNPTEEGGAQVTFFVNGVWHKNN